MITINTLQSHLTDHEIMMLKKWKHDLINPMPKNEFLYNLYDYLNKAHQKGMFKPKINMQNIDSNIYFHIDYIP
jgi:hypothetical protein